MEIKKVLQDLKYRISVTPESDPEYKNAVSLFERLKRKYGITDDDLRTRKRREFVGNKKEEFILVQLLYVVVGVNFDGKDDFKFASYVYNDRRKKNIFNFEVDLTDDEYKNVVQKFDALKDIWNRELKKIEEDLKKEHERRINAFRYSFLDKGNLLRHVDSNESNNDSPKFSMYDVMQAAKYFDEVYFPQSMIDNDKKQIANF